MNGARQVFFLLRCQQIAFIDLLEVLL